MDRIDHLAKERQLAVAACWNAEHFPALADKVKALMNEKKDWEARYAQLTEEVAKAVDEGYVPLSFVYRKPSTRKDTTKMTDFALDHNWEIPRIQVWETDYIALERLFQHHQIPVPVIQGKPSVYVKGYKKLDEFGGNE